MELGVGQLERRLLGLDAGMDERLSAHTLLSRDSVPSYMFVTKDYWMCTVRLENARVAPAARRVADNV